MRWTQKIMIMWKSTNIFLKFISSFTMISKLTRTSFSKRLIMMLFKHVFSSTFCLKRQESAFQTSTCRENTLLNLINEDKEYFSSSNEYVSSLEEDTCLTNTCSQHSQWYFYKLRWKVRVEKYLLRKHSSWYVEKVRHLDFFTNGSTNIQRIHHLDFFINWDTKCMLNEYVSRYVLSISQIEITKYFWSVCSTSTCRENTFSDFFTNWNTKFWRACSAKQIKYVSKISICDKIKIIETYSLNTHFLQSLRA